MESTVASINEESISLEIREQEESFHMDDNSQQQVNADYDDPNSSSQNSEQNHAKDLNNSVIIGDKIFSKDGKIGQNFKKMNLSMSIVYNNSMRSYVYEYNKDMQNRKIEEPNTYCNILDELSKDSQQEKKQLKQEEEKMDYDDDNSIFFSQQIGAKIEKKEVEGEIAIAIAQEPMKQKNKYVLTLEDYDDYPEPQKNYQPCCFQSLYVLNQKYLRHEYYNNRTFQCGNCKQTRLIPPMGHRIFYRGYLNDYKQRFYDPNYVNNKDNSRYHNSHNNSYSTARSNNYSRHYNHDQNYYRNYRNNHIGRNHNNYPNRNYPNHPRNHNYSNLNNSNYSNGRSHDQSTNYQNTSQSNFGFKKKDSEESLSQKKYTQKYSFMKSPPKYIPKEQLEQKILCSRSPQYNKKVKYEEKKVEGKNKDEQQENDAINGIEKVEEKNEAINSVQKQEKAKEENKEHVDEQDPNNKDETGEEKKEEQLQTEQEKQQNKKEEQQYKQQEKQQKIQQTEENCIETQEQQQHDQSQRQLQEKEETPSNHQSSFQSLSHNGSIPQNHHNQTNSILPNLSDLDNSGNFINQAFHYKKYDDASSKHSNNSQLLKQIKSNQSMQYAGEFDLDGEYYEKKQKSIIEKKRVSIPHKNQSQIFERSFVKKKGNQSVCYCGKKILDEDEQIQENEEAEKYKLPPLRNLSLKLKVSNIKRFSVIKISTKIWTDQQTSFSIYKDQQYSQKIHFNKEPSQKLLTVDKQLTLYYKKNPLSETYAQNLKILNRTFKKQSSQLSQKVQQVEKIWNFANTCFEIAIEQVKMKCICQKVMSCSCEQHDKKKIARMCPNCHKSLQINIIGNIWQELIGDY